MPTWLTVLAVTILPLAFGVAVGRAWRGGDRVGGAVSFAAMLAVPILLVVAGNLAGAVIGIWDAVMVGALVGLGIAGTAHQYLAARFDVAILLFSSVIGLVVLEIGCRLALPPPPAIAATSGPHLLLADAREAAARTQFTLADADDSVCHAVFGAPLRHRRPTSFPADWRRRPAARSAILHLGDSMVIGGGGNGRFTEDLSRLEPDVDHINAAIAGTGPDVYLAMLRLYLDRHAIDAVVMHLTGNDPSDLDRSGYSCSGGKSVLRYDTVPTGWRYDPNVGGVTIGRLGWQLRYHPPPFVLRAAVDRSVFAAHALAVVTRLQSGGPSGDGYERLTAILRDTRAETSAKEIPLVVNVWRNRSRIESDGNRANCAETRMVQMARDMGLVTLDTWNLLFDAVHARRLAVFTNDNGPNDIHFSRVGHRLVAEWLHEELPGAFARAMDR